jgi:hypothetical protein
VTTRHLVDPEPLPLVGSFPPMALSADILPAMSTGMKQVLPPAFSSGDALELFVDESLDCARRLVPGDILMERLVDPGCCSRLLTAEVAAVSNRASDDSLRGLHRDFAR